MEKVLRLVSEKNDGCALRETSAHRGAVEPKFRRQSSTTNPAARTVLRTEMLGVFRENCFEVLVKCKEVANEDATATIRMRRILYRLHL